MNLFKIGILIAIFCYFHVSSIAIASSNGGDSERQSLLMMDENSYTVLSIERLGHFTYYQITNRISLKRYSLENNKLLSTDVLMEAQINASALVPPGPTTVTRTDTPLTTLQNMLGDRATGFFGYVRKPKYRIKVSADGLFMDKKDQRTILMTAEQLEQRIPGYLELAEYNAFEVVGLQGFADSHYFVVVRSNEWGSDVGSFEQVIALPNP